jgi:hypothetical protein
VAGAIGAFAIGRPSVHGDHFVVGIDSVLCNDHYLVWISGSVMCGKIRENPIVSYCRVSEVGRKLIRLQLIRLFIFVSPFVACT